MSFSIFLKNVAKTYLCVCSYIQELKLSFIEILKTSINNMIASVTLIERKGILNEFFNATINGNLKGNCEPWA